MTGEVLKGFGNLECSKEQDEALNLFGLLKDGMLTELAEHNFDRHSCDVYFNTSSGNVFLCDEDFNTLMEVEGKLDLFISLAYSGKEGYFDELMENFKDLNLEDKQQLRDLATEDLKEKYKDKFGNLLKEEEAEEL